MITTPAIMEAAAGDLARIGSAIGAANVVAAVPTTVLVAAGADEVSSAVAGLFTRHAQAYQELSAEAATFYENFVQTFSTAGRSYASAEAINVQQTLLNLINAPTQTLLGRPLIGNGANGGTVGGVGQPGGDGGLLYGNGGSGGASTTAGVVGGRGGSAGLIGAGGVGGPVGSVRLGVLAAMVGGYSAMGGWGAGRRRWYWRGRRQRRVVAW
ncbi:PE family protein [Mycobacterium kansasii 824]|nr:PE family protein [Mycobacterium kansasii 824]